MHLGRKKFFTHGKEVPLDPVTGLVDPRHYVDFFPGHIDYGGEEYLQDLPGWGDQHMCFPASNWRSEFPDRQPIDPGILAVGRSVYSQLYMPDDLEDWYHKVHAKEVDHPPFNVAKDFAEDERKLHELGAASLAAAVDNYPFMPESVSFNGSCIDERIAFFTEAKERAITEVVDGIAVMPNMTVAGAIKRLGQKLSDERLHVIAEDRLAPGEEFLPVKILSFHHLWIAASTMFKEHVATEPVAA